MDRRAHVAGDLEYTNPIAQSHHSVEMTKAVKSVLFSKTVPLYPGLRAPSVTWHLDQESRCLMMRAVAFAPSLAGRLKERDGVGSCEVPHIPSAKWQAGTPHNPSEAALHENIRRLNSLILQGAR